MENPGVLNFEVGQLAEMRTFERGFRGAWFRCKIKDVQMKHNKILLEYPDYELEDPSWALIHQVPPYGRKSKHIKKQLMVRPNYPTMYHKSEMPPVNTISETCVVIDGPWKEGDLVDWYKDDCFWSARIVKVLSDDKYQVELPMPPSGEGKEGEDGRHEAFGNDLRPFLDFSETKGWSLHTVDGESSCDAHLVFPTKQGVDLEIEEAAGGGGSPVNASSTTRISTADTEADSEQNVKREGDLMESSESSSSLHVKKRAAAAAEEEDGDDEKRELNVRREHTLEAAMLDLEELYNKLNWMQRILHSPTPTNASAATSSSWKFS